MTPADAAAMVRDGMTVYIGGFVNSSHPMAIVREIIRSGVSGLTVVGAATASMELDLLVAARSARKVITAYIGIEGHAPMGPFYRAYAESGELDVWEIDESMYYTALRAGALNLPFLPDRSGVGTDYMDRLNPDLKVFTDPIRGETLMAVPAVVPDIAFLHAAAADVYGNVRFVGSGFGDRAGVRAAKQTIVQVEKIISNEEIRMEPQRTSLAGVAGVVRAPFGAHPFSSPGSYLHDDEFLADYVAIGKEFLKSRNRTRIDAFLQDWVHGPADHIAYLERVGLRRLLSLHEY